MSRINTLIALGTLALIALVLPNSANAQSFDLTELGTLGGDFSSVVAVNEVDEVAGVSQTRKGETHAFLWSGGRLEDLGTLGGTFSQPTAMNDLGAVVGVSSESSGLLGGFLWTATGGMQGIAISSPVAINNSGEVAGSTGFAAYIWSAAGGAVPLGTLGGSRASASDLNEAGQVAGISRTAANINHAFLWTAGSGMADLGQADNVAGVNELGEVAGTSQGIPFIASAGARASLPLLGSNGGANDINNRGDVVGFSASSLGTRAVIWPAGGSVTDLGTLGGSFSSAIAVNDQGHVVGESTTAAGDLHAFFWSSEGGMVDLGALASSLPRSSAVALNEADLVVGSSNNADASEIAVAWVPLASPPPVPGAIGEIITRVDELEAANDLPGGHANAIRAKLSAAGRALALGADIAAFHLLDKAVRNQLRANSINAAVAAELEAMLDAVLDTL